MIRLVLDSNCDLTPEFCRKNDIEMIPEFCFDAEVEVGAVIGTHAGPGAAAVAYFVKE